MAEQQDGELASLVRRWMASGTGGPGIARQENVIRVLPAPAPVPVVEETAFEVPVFEAPVLEQSVLEVPVFEAPVLEQSVLEEPVCEVPAVEEPVCEAPVIVEERADPPGFRRLPRRTSTGTEPERGSRVALLVDARRVPADVAAGLLCQLAERGSVTVSRAYADWSGADLGVWVEHLRSGGLHSFHHVADDDRQALVALAIDAVDIARDGAVDEVVLAGDLTSSLPLIHRLHAAGVRVVAAGVGHTPHLVRTACDEFIEAGAVDGGAIDTDLTDSMSLVGRHRA